MKPEKVLHNNRATFLPPTSVQVLNMADIKEYPLPLEALKKALAANETLQEQILVELERIGERKATNRRRAAALSLVHATSLARNKAPKEKASTLPDCPWTNTYFVDKKRKSFPGPNEDAVRREKAESSSFFASSNPPWMQKDKSLLEKAIEEVKKESNDGEFIDFVRVAEKVSNKNVSRSPEECRIQSQNLHKKPAWNDTELSRLRAIVNEQKEKSAGNIIDWSNVANMLGNGRTVWEVFQVFQSKIVAKPKATHWTPEEDEFLLKFVAAMGPQHVLNQDCMSLLAARFLPNKTKIQIHNRLNGSLLNPKFVSEAWNEGDERKLALCMKVYSESEPKQALFLSTGHIPNRSRSSVSEKWDRSLDPSFSPEPFTKEEDQELMEVMRANPGMGWKEIATKFFPHRHPHRLVNRFSELAEDQDILDRFGNQLLKKSKDGNLEHSGSVSAVATDYVVKIKKRVRMS